MNDEAGRGVDVVPVDLPGRNIVADAVFRPEEGDEPDARGVPEYVDRADAEPVHPGRVGQQADALSAEWGETVGLQDIDSQHDRVWILHACGGGRPCGRGGRLRMLRGAAPGGKNQRQRQGKESQG